MKASINLRLLVAVTLLLLFLTPSAQSSDSFPIQTDWCSGAFVAKSAKIVLQDSSSEEFEIAISNKRFRLRIDCTPEMSADPASCGPSNWERALNSTGFGVKTPLVVHGASSGRYKAQLRTFQWVVQNQDSVLVGQFDGWYGDGSSTNQPFVGFCLNPEKPVCGTIEDQNSKRLRISSSLRKFLRTIQVTRK